MPSLSPLVLGASTYTASDARAFVLDVTFTSSEFESHFVNVTFPTAAGPPELQVQQGAVVVPITGATGSSAAVPGRSVEWQASLNGPSTVVSLTVTETAGVGAVAQPWTVRGRVPSPVSWTLEVDAPAVTVSRVLCDPVAAFSVPPPASIGEQTPLVLTAALATTATVVGTPAPPVSYRFSAPGTVPFSPLPVCQPGQVLSLHTPGVYADVELALHVDVAFADCASMPTAWLQRTSAAAAVRVTARPQRAVVVVDRSGSMAGDRWQNAELASKMALQLFYAFREGVDPDDRIGVVAFEDAGCRWGTGSVPATTTVLPLSRPLDADSAACGLPLGSPGSCTPIGDGLIAGMDLLVGGPEDVRCTLVLLTDGYENSGRVMVGPGPLPAGVRRFATARTEGSRAAVSSVLSLYTIGLGSTVDEPVLNALPELSPGVGRYLLVTDAAALSAAFGHLLSFSQDADAVTTTALSSSEVVLTTAAGADKLGVAVLASGGDVELSFRPASGGPWSTGPASRSCDDVHAVAVHAVPALGIPGAVQWRVRHRVGGVAQPLSPTRVLAFEDLRVHAEVVLDRPSYDVGGALTMTVHLRDGGQAVLGARVVVELDAPDVGLGQVLTRIGPKYRPPEDDPDGRDAPTGKGHMVATALRMQQWEQLPRRQRTGVFADGTDVLHDPDGSGDYRNVFHGLDHEGTYTWRVRAQGYDTTGEPFDRVLAVSTWAGIAVDAKASAPRLTWLQEHPSGRLAVEVAVRPQDERGRPLGPFWDAEVVFAVRGGDFEHVLAKRPAPVRFDGTYRRTVLLHPEGGTCTLTVSARGTVVGPVVLRRRRPWVPPLPFDEGRLLRGASDVLQAAVQRLRRPPSS